MSKKCLLCNKILIGRQTKYCSKKCLQKQLDRTYYLKNKEIIIKKVRAWDKKNPEKVKASRKKSLKKFIKNNPERFKELMKKNYNNNKGKWNERKYVHYHRSKIIKIIGDKCKYCGAPLEEIHHTKYENLPRGNLEEYCKYLIPMCKPKHRTGICNKNRKI